MDLNRLLAHHDALIRAAALKYTKHFTTARHIEVSDDLINEARIAAWKAIRTYQTGKNAKIETYITVCIRNRMIELHRKAHRQCRPELTFPGEKMTQVADLQATEDPTEQLTEVLTLKKILNDREYHVLSHLKSGGCIDVLVAEYQTRKRTPVEARHEVVLCLHRIRRKLKLRGLSLSV